MSDEQTLRFQETFVKAGGFVSSSVKAQRHPNAGGGFGVMAKQRMRAGTLVAAVPASLFLTAASSRQREGLNKQTVPSPIAAICIHLVRQRLRLIEQLIQTKPQEALLDPRAAGGFSLSHIDLTAVSETGDLHNDWIARLPSQYDNLIQFAPHLDWLSMQNEGNDAAAVKQQQQPTQEIIDAWMEVACAFDPDQTHLAEEQEQQQQQDLVCESLLALGLPRRYAIKTAQEILNWRRMAKQHVKFLSLSPPQQQQQQQQQDSSSSSSSSPSPSSLLPPGISALISAHRSKLAALGSTSAKAACAARFFSSDDERLLLVELYGWANSTLMSRGFSHSDEVWVMQPWVDYLNYSPYQRYNVSTGFNTTLNRFEFKVRAGGSYDLRPQTELTLHYGTYCDFELSLWYGFVLCQDCRTQQSAAKGRKRGSGIYSAASSSKDDEENPGDADDDETQHQPECEYVLSPLSDSDGEFSVAEFSQFVSEVILLAILEGNDSASAAAAVDRSLLNKCSVSVVKKLCRSTGSDSPRCSIRRGNRDFEPNSTMESLLEEVVEILNENQIAADKSKSRGDLTTEKLLAWIVSSELSRAFGTTKTASLPAATLLMLKMAEENSSSAAGFARQIGADIRSILKGAQK